MKTKNIKFIILVLIFTLSLAACKNSENTETKTKKEVKKEIVLKKELDKSYDKNVDSIANKAIEKNIIPGMVILVTKNNKIIFEKAYGYAQLNESSEFNDIANPLVKKIEKPRKMKEDTLFDLASVTKVASTTQAIMKLVYERKIKVDDLITKYIPEFEKNGKENITIKELLTHTSGLPQWGPSFLYVKNDREKLLQYITELKPIFEKGNYKYSDFGFMTLGYIIEKVSGKTLDKYVEEEIYKPLGMNNTFYKPLEHGISKDKIAATSLGNPFEYKMVDETNYPDFGYDTKENQEAFNKFNDWRKYTLIGEVNDGNAGMASSGIAGHAGLFSNVEDLAILTQMMLNGGEINNVRIYDKATITEFTKNYIGNNNRGYGFELNAKYMGDNVKNAYGHNGFTGTHVIINPDKNMSFIILTNKQNLGLNEKGVYNGTFKLVNEIVNEFIK